MGWFSKNGFLPMQEPGPGTGGPICIFFQPLGLYVSARVIPLDQIREGIYTVGCFLDQRSKTTLCVLESFVEKHV